MKRIILLFAFLSAFLCVHTKAETEISTDAETGTTPFYITDDFGTHMGYIETVFGIDEDSDIINTLSRSTTLTFNGSTYDESIGKHWIGFKFHYGGNFSVTYHYHFTIAKDNEQNGGYDIHRRHVTVDGRSTYAERDGFSYSGCIVDPAPAKYISDSATSKYYANGNGNIDISPGASVCFDRSSNLSVGVDCGVTVGSTVSISAGKVYDIHFKGLIWQDHSTLKTHTKFTFVF